MLCVGLSFTGRLYALRRPIFSRRLYALRGPILFWEALVSAWAFLSLGAAALVEQRHAHRRVPAPPSNAPLGPRSKDTASPPTAAIGPYAYSYCRDLRARCFL